MSRGDLQNAVQSVRGVATISEIHPVRAISKQPPTPAQETLPAKRDSWRMFDRVAKRYDLLNAVLSLGVDRGWRRAVCRKLPACPERLRVLDLATGTADQLIAVLKSAGTERVAMAVGLDPAEKMLEAGRAKLTARGLTDIAELRRGDAMAIDSPDGAFDVVTMAFGIRNVADPQAALKEIHRVLAGGGRALILEFSLPRNALVRAVYLFYFRHVLPKIGGWVSGDPTAYRYLNHTVEEFPYGNAFLDRMRAAGFQNTGARELTFGIATLYWGERQREARNPC